MLKLRIFSESMPIVHCLAVLGGDERLAMWYEIILFLVVELLSSERILIGVSQVGRTQP